MHSFISIELEPRGGPGTIDGLLLAHDDTGAGPAVVLLHAGIADRTMWAEHLEPLAAAGFRVLALDLPGFGDSPPASEENVPWGDVLETIDALGIERVTLVGCSFGGAVAQRVAALSPERVEALVLISSPAEGIDPSPALEAAWELEEDALELGDIDAAVEAVLAAWLPPEASGTVRARVAEMQRRAFEIQLAGADAPEGEDPLESDPDALARVTAPAYVLAGEHDMPDFQRAADALAQALPAGRQARVARAAHLAPLEQPLAFRELLLSFLT